ncbi:unnamed protein product, partial [Prorocentrum cordatum]
MVRALGDGKVAVEERCSRDAEALAHALRRDLACAFEDGDEICLLVNYLRPGGGGHWSPLGGYAEDRVLILDTNSQRHPPHWVPCAALVDAMCCNNPRTGRPRGYLALQREEDRGDRDAPQGRADGPPSRVIHVDPNHLGMLIGRKGETIKNMSDSSGARVEVCKEDSGHQPRAVTITGSLEAIDRAQGQIDEVLMRARERDAQRQQGHRRRDHRDSRHKDFDREWDGKGCGKGRGKDFGDFGAPPPPMPHAPPPGHGPVPLPHYLDPCGRPIYHPPPMAQEPPVEFPVLLSRRQLEAPPEDGPADAAGAAAMDECKARVSGVACAASPTAQRPTATTMTTTRSTATATATGHGARPR